MNELISTGYPTTPTDTTSSVDTDYDNSSIARPSLPVSAKHSPPPNRPPLTALQKWGLDLSSGKLLAGLAPWPHNPPIEETTQPLSSLGHFADDLYKLGPITLPEYHAQLAGFIDVAFPKSLRKEFSDALDEYTRDGEGKQAWDVQKIIWQTDKDESRKNDRRVKSWSEGQAQNEGWKYELVTDA